jgi:hypothetical protein
LKNEINYISGSCIGHHWLSSFGPDLEVILPEALRATIAELHRKVAQLYKLNFYQ